MEERPHRQKRIAELIKRTVGNIVSEEVGSEDYLITISAVYLSPNHQHATVLVTIYPYESSNEVIKKLENGIGGIQKRLNGELRMRPVPKITFKPDESEEKGQNILDLLDKVK